MTDFPLKAVTSFNDNDSAPLMHSCISSRVYGRFSSDGQLIQYQDTSCKCNDSHDDGEDTEGSYNNMDPPDLSSHSPSPSPPPSTFPSPFPRQRPLPRALRTIFESLERSTRPLSQMASIPATLWDRQWIAPTYPVDQIIALSQLKHEVFREATKGEEVTPFELRGLDVSELAQALILALEAAGEEGDFTSILSPD